MTESVTTNDVNDVAAVEAKTEADELVSKKVVDEYKNDMFKYKAKMKETEGELQKLRDAAVLAEKQSLEDKEEWKLLYEKEKEEGSKARVELENKSKFFVDTSKINSVVQKLGGFKKNEYSKFVNTSNVDVLEDGTFDRDSIAREVDRIKQEFPELLLGPKPSKMPNEAPANMAHTSTKAPSSKHEIGSALLAELRKGD